MVTNVARATTARNPAAVRARVLAALGAIIERDGLAGLGVNALARAAGCDKVLIYRYFGDLDGVCREFAESRDFWWTVEELVDGVDPARMTRAQALQLLMRRHAQAIRRRPITLAILAHELTQRSTLVAALEAVRERRTLDLLAWIDARFEPPAAMDLPALALLLGAAVNYLAVRGRGLAVMNGVPIRSDADWERILSAIDALIAGALTQQ